MEKISVITVTFNSEDVVGKFLDGLLNIYDGIIDDIVVIDNASSDNTVKVLKSRENSKIKILVNESNIGFRRAINQAFLIVQNEIVLVANPDMIITENSLETCYTQIVENTDVAYTFPVVINSNPIKNYYHTSFAIPGLSEYSGFNSRNLPEDVTQVEIGCGQFYLTRKTVFLEVGGFNENIFMYKEEHELALKYSRKGKRILFCPRDVVFDIGGHSVNKLTSPLLFYILNNQRAAFILYEDLCCDDFQRRMIWWSFYLLDGLLYSIATKSKQPLGLSIDSFRHRKMSHPKKENCSCCTFWHVDLHIKERIKYFLLHMKSK